MTDYRDLWEEAVRSALVWRARYERLYDAVDDFTLCGPGVKGHAEAYRSLMKAFYAITEGDTSVSDTSVSDDE